MDAQRHYVYALIDPRTAKPFYVGKGVAARRFKHFSSAPVDRRKNPDKLKVLDDIAAAGLKPQAVVLSWHATQEAAYEAEVLHISEIGLENLTNQNKGGAGKKVKDRVRMRQLTPKQMAKAEALIEDRKARKEIALTVKQMNFAQNVIKGMTLTDAYRAAYDVAPTTKMSSVNDAARVLRRDPRIAALVDAAIAKTTRQAISTREDVVDLLYRALELAESTDQASAMVSAAKEIARLQDLYPAEKRENFNHDMTNIADRIREGRERLRVVGGKG